MQIAIVAMILVRVKGSAANAFFTIGTSGRSRPVFSPLRQRRHMTVHCRILSTYRNEKQVTSLV